MMSSSPTCGDAYSKHNLMALQKGWEKTPFVSAGRTAAKLGHFTA
jgi:hypothetical protein